MNSSHTPFCTESQKVKESINVNRQNSIWVLLCVCRFYTRWKEWESWYSQSFGLHFSLREEQWQEDWAFILSLASQVHAHESKHPHEYGGQELDVLSMLHTNDV